MSTIDTLNTSTLSLLSNSGFVAITVAIITVIGAKVIENWTKGKESKVDEGTAIRIELRAEVKALKEELISSRMRTDEWREKYFILLEKYNVIARKEKDAISDLDNLRDELEQTRKLVEMKTGQEILPPPANPQV